jgi:hypothetical protein
MANLTRIVEMLEEQRRDLMDQVDAIDRALAALDSPEPAVPEPRSPERDVLADAADTTVRPTQVKARRVLTDAHKHAVSVGKRKALEAQDVAKGIAREQPDDNFVPAIGARGERQAPRLVKRPIKK